MNDGIMFGLLFCGAAILIGFVIFQSVFCIGMKKKLSGMTKELEEILDKDIGAYLMVFTDNKELSGLAGQINRLLEKHQKTKADFYRSEMASKRMLSNISHDIKTPMTVVLGYLEIMRLQGECSGEMLEKTEQKAQQVIELINQFFSLAKLEAGDMDIELSRLDAGGICRETVLGFYKILTEKNSGWKSIFRTQPFTCRATGKLCSVFYLI